MKIQFLSLFLAMALLLPFASATAQKAPADDASGNSNVQQGVGRDQAVQAEVQAQTQNQGEATKMMTQTREAVQTDSQNQAGDEEMVAGMREDASNGQKGIQESGSGRDNSAQPGNGQAIGVSSGAQVKNAGEARRSQVANAVQAMIQVAERSGGVGEQIRVIAQNQNKNQQEMEAGLEKVQTRNKAMKFLFGPNYKQVRAVESKMEAYSGEIEKLKAAAEQLVGLADQEVIAEQIAVMEQAGEELQAELDSQQKGFSLFGWLAKMLVK